MEKNTTIIILLVLFSLNITAQNLIEHTYSNTDGPDKNPMKGWNSGWWDNFDEASVGFQYLKWKDFEPADGNFDFNAVETIINRPGSSGKHIILRLYTDWFGNDQTSDAGPQWLYNDYGVERLQAPNGKYITNYNHPNYISQVLEAIEALANQYQDDPRIYALQLGVLGYWGEWHTYSYNDPSFDIENTSMAQVINAYKTNFPSIRVMGRYPWREPLSTDGQIGFHNDFFVPNNGHSDEFDDAILAGNKWLDGPIGGEIPPIDNSEQFMTDLYETATGMTMIETGHYSTMKVGSDERPCENNPSGQKCIGFMTMHRKMGYNYQIESALFAETLTQSNNLSVDLIIKNIGVAPMYYDWDVQFALLDQDDQPTEIFEATYDVTSILSDQSATVSIGASLNTIPNDDYQLAVRLIQPGAENTKTDAWGLDARNAYVLFSNDLPTIDGTWDANNALVGGWSVLGNVSIEESTLSLDDENPLENTISIYPNPSKNNLIIAKNGTVLLKHMDLYDITGRLIKTIDLENMAETKTIDISTLSAGIYNLIVHTENKQLQKRLIKQ